LVARIVAAINDVRATNNPSRHEFDHLGDILAVPELTTSTMIGPNALTRYIGSWPNGYWAGVSPLVNLGQPSSIEGETQSSVGVDDATYERIPQQILGLLKCDHTPRFVIYAYGQALKPADRSIYMVSGPYFNLCTNYQVTAETAIRAVVRVDGAPNKPHAVIESFNVLPPD
jgi:hypothetical protein